MMKMNSKIEDYDPDSDKKMKTAMTAMMMMKICMTKWIQMQSQP